MNTTIEKHTGTNNSWAGAACRRNIPKSQKLFLLLLLLLLSKLAYVQSPGGVSASLKLWLKANANVTPNTQGGNVTGWSDQSGGSNDALFTTPIFSQTVVNPTFQQNSMNFNPVVRFGGTTASSFAALQGSFATPVTSTNVSAYVVAKVNSTSGSGRLFMISVDPTTSDWQNPQSADLMSRSGNNIIASRNSAGAGSIGPVVGLPAFLASTHFTAANQAKMEFNSAAFTTTAFTTAAFNAGTYRLGQSTYSANDWLNGDIAEVVLYTADQSSTGTNHNQIESYLAVKYGIHKAGNYVNSSGTVIWDATANATYHNDVFGIGQDNGSALMQTQSNSMNTGDGAGTGQSGKGNIIVSTPSALTNNGFLMIGHNTNDFSLVTTNMPAGSLSNFARLNRTWKTQTTGSTGTVSVQFDATGLALPGSLSNVKLIVDTDGDGNFATGTVTPFSSSSVTGNVIRFDNVTFPVGATFSFATLTVTPGGSATGISLWLDANNGAVNSGGNVTAWNDRTAINTFTLSGSGVQYVTNAVNFNPAARFSGTQKFIGNTITGMSEFYAVAAWNGPTNIERGTIVSPQTSTSGGASRYAFRAAVDNNLYVGSFDPAISTGVYMSTTAPPSGIYDIWTASGTGNVLRKDGTATGSGSYNGTIMTDKPQVGDRSTNDSKMNGWIAEVITYNISKAGAGRDNVESYLAVKYGIHKAGNYFNSANTVIWDATANAAYDNDVFGIGRDSASGLLQVLSNSMNTGSGDGTGQSGKGNIVLSNPSALTNNGFLMVGHNTNDFSLVTTNMPAGSLSNFARLNRTWKSQTTGSTGAVSLQFDATALSVPTPLSNLKLLIDADGDGNFATGTVTQLSSSSVAGNVVRFDNVTLPAGATFTFATIVVSPGGIFGNLKLWLKANANVTPSTPGGNVTAWSDQSGGNNNALFVSPLTFSNSATTNAINPTFQQNTFNFNPGVNFAGTSNTNFAALQGSFATPVTSNNVSAYIVANIPGAGSGTGRLFTISLNPTTLDWQNNAGAALIMRNPNNVDLFIERNGGILENNIPVINLPPLIASTHFTASNQLRAAVNGSAFTSRTFNSVAFNAGTYRLGQSTYTTGDYFNGDIAEVVFYTADQSSAGTNHNQIESYLAVKYGIHKAGNYINSSGTVIWDSTANAVYHHDVFGIGQDDGSSLLQTQSNSVNTGSGDGTGQGAKGNIVIGNWSSLANNNFYMIGHSINDLALTTSGMPTGSPANLARLARTWKTQLTGSVGTIDLSFNATGVIPPSETGNIRLLIDADGDGDFTTGTITTVMPTSVNGNVLAFNALSIPAGATFTFATLQERKSPGGSFGGLTLWLDAKNGLTNSGGNIGGWIDQAGINTFTTGIGQYAPNAVNFNPAASFNNTAGQNLIGNTAIGMTEFYTVAAWTGTDLSVSRGHVLSTLNRSAGNGFERDIFISTGGDMVMQYDDYIVGSPLRATGAAPLSGIFNVWTASGVGNVVRRDASGLATTGGPVGAAMTDVPRIAGRPDATRVQFNGQIAEVIAYNTNKTGAGRDNIESYLAVKYGIHKAGNYINSANTVIWDSTLNAAYHHDVFGIGRDDTSGLMQVKSNSMNTGSGNGTGQSGLGNIVLSNPSALANLSYFMVGHDVNDFSLVNTNLPLGVPADYVRLNRLWKVEQTGIIGTVNLSFDATGIASLAGKPLLGLQLIIDHDGDGNFTTGTVDRKPVDSISGNVVTFKNVTFSPAVFTLGVEAPLITITGTVWDDANGSVVQEATEPGTNAGNQLFVALIDRVADTLVASTPVNADGTYTLNQVPVPGPANQYTVILTNSATGVTPALPASYVFTGQDSAGVALTTTPGSLPLSITTLSFTNINFGIEQLPLTTSVTLTDVPNIPVFNLTNQPGYLGANMSTSPLEPLSGTDIEDCPAGCSSGSNFVIQSILPGTLLFYDGLPVAALDTIRNFDVTKMIIYGLLGNGTAANPVGFDYSLIDAAHKASAVAAQYRITTQEPLPVTLISFKAQKDGCNGITLNWAVENAISFSHFEVERSADGIRFVRVATLAYKEGQAEYRYAKDSLADGRYQYRLKLVDMDGSFKISNIVSVDIDCQHSGIVVIPNPAHNQVQVQGITGSVVVRIINIQGQVVLVVPKVSEGEAINISHLPAAVYLIQIIKEGNIVATVRLRKM